MLALDTVLAGKYRIVSVIGEGGYGKVYLGYDIGMDRQVAIKELSADGAGADEDKERYRRRFQKEAQLTSQFSHPNIVSAFALESDEAGNVYLVLEYVDGENLKSLIEREAPLPADKVLGIGIDICQAIEAIYKRDIVHRDIKPSNILLDHEGRAKLTDFGIAQSGHETRRTQEATAHPGTPAYRSPEQATTTGYLDQRSDLYALGLVLYEALTGYLYVRNRVPPRRHNSSVPPALDDVVMKALEENPGDRYQTAQELRAELQAVREQSLWGQARIVLRRLRKSYALAATAGHLALLLLVAGYRFFGAALQALAAGQSVTGGGVALTPTVTPTAALGPVVLPVTATQPPTAPGVPTEFVPTSTSTLTPTPTVTLTPTDADLFEPDEKSPAPILIGETQHRTFAAPGDVDRIAFRVKAGRTYVATTSNLAEGVDTSIEALVNGQSLSNQDASPGTLASQVTFVAAEDGMAVVSVTNQGTGYGNKATYDLSVFEALPTSTPTAEITATTNPSVTVYATFTPRPTFTPMGTGTSTPAGTVTTSMTPSITPTPSSTASRTPTATLTRTPTATRTVTPTPSRTLPPTATYTITNTPPPTLTPTPNRSPLPVKTVLPPVK